MIYAGIGSRETPEHILKQFVDIGRELAELGYTLRSGGADGADSAFEDGCDLTKGNKEIFLPWKNFNGNKSKLYEPSKDAFDIAKKYHPMWGYLKQGAKRLHARNAHQVLGLNLDMPVDFIICWTRGVGGTNQALRIARPLKIPIFNYLVKNYEIKDILKESSK